MESIHENTIAWYLAFYTSRETSEYEFRFKTGTSSGFCMKKGNHHKKQEIQTYRYTAGKDRKNRHM